MSTAPAIRLAQTGDLAPKMVDHHVAAILRKLGVHTRGEAGAAARRLGLTAEDH